MNAGEWVAAVAAVVLGNLMVGVTVVNAQDGDEIAKLNEREAALVRISAHSAVGNLDALDTALCEGLDAGLSINQIKAALEQLYAYCGFPRSLNGINTLRTALDRRAKNGVRDNPGESYQPVVDGDRYERGRLTLEKLTGVAQAKPAPGFGEFSPEIDRFLKEHLFADIFDNPVLTHRERELVTIAALAAMDGVGAQLKAHVGIGRNTGIADAELAQIADLIGVAINESKANQLRQFIVK
ncbi:MAG: carboxymuconolactone decarboxylase family protein [Kiritimatiellae bacterium]|nr:carboxymuconolactone decarboxylase family protein [Kiritimatiellia bacterium]MCO5062773.1 carboxymuconolactone decarboxylase family protein [Kiritimatiellia bacterium]MCO6401499.1 carboxymuconolactone decarboxylase family protein [Verrucomicrobiota bacterium]